MSARKNDGYFEVSELNSNDLPNDAWKVRPCHWYKEEYKDCQSIKAKFHQFFVYGETIDCSQWKDDYQNCMQFRKKKDLKFLESVIESENQRQKERTKTIEQNDVWVYRTSPPETWNSPMPKWMQENKKDSLLSETQNMLNEGIDPTPIFTGFSCTIM
ncbi:uncharacterized protein NPIL_558741 [Nephila pilipes]|uniref:Synaptic plasticity regulator PANTS n=1 Tax=Nephila pilipes TaxID=299642 RepID=A0A8X6MC52_NEPPI|nr:uncharacterized protein NPIL_558741 [Nephila pilipes]